MGLEQAAVAMLRTLGAGRVVLLIPQPATAGSQSGLAIAAPMASEVEVEPVLLQANVSGSQLLAITTAATLRRALSNVLAPDADATAMAQALEMAMLKADGCQYRISAVTAKWFGGAALMYELQIEA
jgi:hypothetical protein